ncbi:lipopolysaccharide biosynthesis protein [Hamadaea tsunoensis]|uniref:lipopolysaccharide biosynthesis protein n=1 Tax=Hamadaea tsunoensis TaxID=53368 RepID=UPI0004239F92|nr:hypothetical protein [Hamadaea tsunoensis]
MSAAPRSAEPTSAPPLGRGLLKGTTSIATALVVLGASGYAFLAVTARIVPAADYAALAALYLLMAVFGGGLFSSVELETSRLVSGGAARGEPTGTAVRQMRLVSTGLLVLVSLAMLAAGRLLVDRVFNGDPWLLAGLLAACAGFAVLSLPRGTFAGRGRLPAYAATIGGEGLARLLPCLILAAAGVTAAAGFGVALGLGPLLAGLLCVPWLRLGAPGGHVPWRTLLPAVGWLAGSALLSLGLANLGPVVVKAILVEDPARAGVFAFAFVLARVPQFLFTSAQTALLPALTRAAATGDHARLRQGVRQAVLVVAALGALGVLGTILVGGFVIRVLFDSTHGIGALDLGLLGLGAAFAMMMAVLQSALLALAKHRLVTLAYALGFAGFVLCFLLPLDPVAAGLAAQLVSGVITVAVMLHLFRRYAR